MRIEKVGVVGAGTMGSGIAQACARRGYTVVLTDTDEGIARKGVERVREVLTSRVKKGRMSEAEVQELLKRIHTGGGVEAHAECDLVIEAVFEDRRVKEGVFRGLDSVCREDALLATNTSSLSVSSLSESVSGRRRDRFIGLHFFYPAAVNLLVEVIPLEGTDPQVEGSAVRFTRALGKIPIRVKDAPGFAVNRYFVPILNEACRLLDEGINTATIERYTMDALGISMGPFALMKATGIPIAYHAESALGEALGGTYIPCEGLKRIYEAGDVEVTGDVDPSREGIIRDTLLGMVFSISTKVVEEGVSTPRDVDIGALVGLRWKRGPFALMNRLGPEKALDLASRYEERSGGALPVPPLLRRMGEMGERWELPMVAVERNGHIARVVIRRPEAMNALNDIVLKEMEKAFTTLREDEDIWVVLLMGEGRSFIAGADIRLMLNGSMEDVERFTRYGQDVSNVIERLRQPVIALVNGYALGGGCEMMLACDIAVASASAKIGLPEVTLGIHPGFGGTQRLPRRVPPNIAKEMIYTGTQLSARDAERIGLVNRVVSPMELYDEGERLAETICRNGPLAVAFAKSAVNTGLEQSLKEGMETEINHIMKVFRTEDKTEGLKAFVEKRRPRFTGR